MTELVTRPAASIERKVVGGSLVGFLTVVALAALEYFVPEEAADLAPAVEIMMVYLATVIGSYMTRSRRPMPVKEAEPVEPFRHP